MSDWTTKSVIICICLLAPGCDERAAQREAVSEAAFAAKADGLDWLEGDPVRIAMAQVRSDLPEMDYWSLLHEGDVTLSESSQPDEMASFLRKGLRLAIARGDRELEEEHLRVWRYRLGADLPPMLVNHDSTRTTIPFKMKAESSVEFARAFESSQEASFADPLTLMDLPHDAESALALPMGSVVSIPIEGRLSVDVNGRFLNRAASYSPELAPFINSSVTGTTSGLRQGTIVTEGELLFQVIRLNDARVRLRVSTGATVSGDLNLGLDARALAFYRFVPCAAIDRARAIKTRLDKTHRQLSTLGSVDDRIERLRARVDGKLNPLFLLPIPALEGPLREASNTVDWAFNRALDIASAAHSLEVIEAAVLTRTERLLKRGIDDWNAYLEPTLRQITQWSSRTYNLNSSVVFNTDAMRRVRTLADYEFDLSDPDARRAFDRAITGRALWMDVQGWFGGGSLERMRLSDLTLADDLANNDATADAPRVIRHATAFGDLRTQHYNVHLSGPWMSLGIDWDHSDNRVVLVDHEGLRTEWEARAWHYERKTSWFGSHDATTFASGAFIELGQADLLGGGYWFSWSKQHDAKAHNPVARSLGEFVNLLGPVAIDAGIPALYDGEHEGQISANLDVLFSGEAMDYLFDPLLTDDVLLWRIFGEVAETFDNRDELPLIIDPIRPLGLEEIDGAVEACEKVAYHFGGWYCAYFADTFLPALREAQASEDPRVRLSFLERFYEKGWFGKPVGARLLVRYLASLMAAIGLSDEISIRADVRNAQDDSLSASPTLERGSAEALTLIETMSVEALR